jgi:F0F1-type ATP synthase assembly protein I
LDSWLGTAPAFLIIFLLLGSGAGILNAVRTARRMQVGGESGGKG